MNNYTRSRQRWAFAAGALMVLFFVALVWLLSSCETPAPVVPLADGGGQTTDGCEVACSNLERLHCPEAKPNARGMGCAEVCHRAERVRDMNIGCLAVAKDLDDLQECGSVRCVW